MPKETYKDYLSYSKQDRTTIITKTVNYIFKYLTDVAGFEQAKAFQFILFMLYTVTGIDGELSEAQFEIFKEATGIQYGYQDLINNYHAIKDDNDIDNLNAAILSYGDECKTNIYLFIFTILAVKGDYTEKEVAFLDKLQELEKAQNEALKKQAEELGMKTISEDELGVDPQISGMLNKLLGLEVEKREEIAKHFLKEMKIALEESVEPSSVVGVLMYITGLIIKNIEYGDKSSLFTVVNSIIDEKLTYADLEKVMNDIKEEDTDEIIKLTYDKNVNGDAATYIIALASVNRIVGESIMSLADDFLNYSEKVEA